MVKELLFIHPLGQAVAFVFGLFNLITGWTHKCFVRALHINFGVMFYVLTFIGSVMGLLTARRAAHEDIFLSSPVHLWLAVTLIVFLLCGMLSGFFLMGKTGMRTWAHVLHRYCNLFVVLFFIAQLISGGLVLAKVF